jgi:myo-inositol-1(or 4)-monophosphatase
VSALSASDALALATEAAREAGALLLELRRSPAAGVRSKSSATDLVSEADERAERAIVTTIRKRRPDDAVVAEEGSNAAGSSGVSWFVDPLDGTINYLYGIPHWSVSICCADMSGPLAGVVYDPLRGELFGAARGSGARLGDARLAVTDKADLASALIATGFGYVAAQRVTQGRIIAKILGEVRDVRRFGSAALDLAWLAAGRWDGYFESVEKPWDWMAGALLVREAGGRVTELKPKDAAFPRIVASGPGIHDGLVTLLAGATEGL